MTSPVMQTPLVDHHQKLGARMIDFAGWTMPIQYSGIVDEHQCVRQNMGLFDVSHMGEIRITGPQALAFAQWLTPNDVGKLTDGKAQYSMLCNEQGGVIDDILVYRISEQDILLVVNAGTTPKDWAWIQSQHTSEWDCQIENQSKQYGQLALQGPKAVSFLQKFCKEDISSLSSFCFLEGDLTFDNHSIPTLISRTGYTGEDGFELYCDSLAVGKLWQELIERGKAEGLKPIGLGARDTLRLEMKYPLYGQDLDDDHTPLEAGLGWVVKLGQDNFIGKSALAQQKEKGCDRKWVGLVTLERGIPRHGYPVFSEEGKKIGVLTSGGHSPTLGKGIGCGYLDMDSSQIGQKVQIEIRNKKIPSEIVKTPFIPPQGKR